MGLYSVSRGGRRGQGRNFWNFTAFDKYLIKLGDSVRNELKSKRYNNEAISLFFSQMSAVHPVGEGQCIALGYESVLPLVLLTLQGADMEPYEFPTEDKEEMIGTGVIY